MVNLGIQVMVGYLFLSTGISKILRPTEHLSRINEYKIIPSSYLARIFLVLSALSEIVFSIMLLCKKYGFLSSWVLLCLLSIYTVAILINLYKGNKIQCGCGGFVGDSRLSWKTILRNLTLASLITYVIYTNKNETIITELDAHSTILIYAFILLLFVLNTMYKKISMLNTEYIRILTR